MKNMLKIITFSLLLLICYQHISWIDTCTSRYGQIAPPSRLDKQCEMIWKGMAHRESILSHKK